MLEFVFVPLRGDRQQDGNLASQLLDAMRHVRLNRLLPRPFELRGRAFLHLVAVLVPKMSVTKILAVDEGGSVAAHMVSHGPCEGAIFMVRKPG